MNINVLTASVVQNAKKQLEEALFDPNVTPGQFSDIVNKYDAITRANEKQVAEELKQVADSLSNAMKLALCIVGAAIVTLAVVSVLAITLITTYHAL